jgi:ribosomal protein L3 glutamine methyltransferase
MTLFELVERCRTALESAGVSFGQGTTNALDEAAWLVLWRLNLPLDTDLEHDQRTLSAEQQAQVGSLLDERIRTRQPLAYLTGEAWLQGVPFFVDRRSIIPRSLIAEVLAMGLLDEWVPTEQARVMDLCTGNGSLAVLSALAWPQAMVHGLDLSPEALQVAERNVQRHALTDRIELSLSDGFAAARGQYDLILCNPPYVNQQSMDALPQEFQAEPRLALAGGEDGMDFIRPCLQQASRWLTPTGALVLEIGHELLHFERAFPQLMPWWLETSAGDTQVALLRAADLASLS